MAGLRQGHDSKTVPVVNAPSSMGDPKPESIQKMIKLTKAQIRFRLLDAEPEHRTEKKQAISALLRIREERKDILQEVLPTVCLSLKLEYSGGANADQDMIGNLLSVLVHASSLNCDLTNSYEQLQALLENGTVAQKHSVAITISKMEENGVDIAPLVLQLVKSLEPDSCDPTARMVIAKTLVNAATRSLQNARSILENAIYLDPLDPYVSRVITRCQGVLRVSDKPDLPLVHPHAVPSIPKQKAFFFDTIVEEDPRGAHISEETVESKKAENLVLEDVVRLLWESQNPMIKKGAVDTILAYIKSVESAREVLSMLPAESQEYPNSFVNGIRRRCCRILSEGMPESDYEPKSGK